MFVVANLVAADQTFSQKQLLSYVGFHLMLKFFSKSLNSGYTSSLYIMKYKYFFYRAGQIYYTPNFIYVPDLARKIKLIVDVRLRNN